MAESSDDDPPARFCIPVTLDDGEAIITNLLDADGIETTDFDKAVVAVAQFVTGEDVGCWVTFTVEPDDFVLARMH